MIFVKNAETLRFELFNKAGEELLGIPREAMIGKADTDFFPPDQAAFFEEKDRGVLNDKKLVDIPLEPIDTDLRPGARLRSGDPVGTIALGGHTAAGALHFGVRLHGEYVNPMLLLGGVPRAVLLPCC